MCGRFNLRTNAARFVEIFGAPVPDDSHSLLRRNNIAPTQTILTISASEGHRSVQPRKWGLVPGWAKDPRIGNRMINARSETVASRPSFRAAFRKRRCLIPASGFYEWKPVEGSRKKQPYHIAPLDGQPMAFAGLWERWQPPGADPLETTTIITTSSNDVLRDLHDRMPVILPPLLWDRWLGDQTPAGELQEMLVPAPNDFLDYEPIDRIESP